MQRHDVDPVSLFAGLAFALIAGGYALSHAGNVHVDWIVAVPAGLIAVGATILAAVARRIRPARDPEAPRDV